MHNTWGGFEDKEQILRETTALSGVLLGFSSDGKNRETLPRKSEEDTRCCVDKRSVVSFFQNKNVLPFECFRIRKPLLLLPLYCQRRLFHDLGREVWEVAKARRAQCKVKKMTGLYCFQPLKQWFNLLLSIQNHLKNEYTKSNLTLLFHNRFNDWKWRHQVWFGKIRSMHSLHRLVWVLIIKGFKSECRSLNIVTEILI